MDSRKQSATNANDDDLMMMVQRIDGSQGEGGGQILRNAISFASILHRPLIVSNIRAKRTKPGLRAQHATGLLLATQIAGGSLVGGAEMESQEIHYEPGNNISTALDQTNNSQDNKTDNGLSTLHERTFTGDTGTAGSICLLLQVALPGALFFHRDEQQQQQTPCHLVLKGGTNASLAPQYDYWERVFWPTLRNCCGLPPDQVQIKVVQRGYYPAGRGHVEARIQPLTQPLSPIQLTQRGEVVRFYIRSFHAGKLPRFLAEKMARAAKKALLSQSTTSSSSRSTATPPSSPRIEVEVVTETQAYGSGLGILVLAETCTGCLLAGSALSRPGQKPEHVGVEAANELLATLSDGGCVDEWLQDQLILFMALAAGESQMLTGSLTLHTQTAIWIAETMTGVQFHVTRIIDDDAAASNNDKPAAVAAGGLPEYYGQAGRIPGRHLVRCRGIGFCAGKN